MGFSFSRMKKPLEQKALGKMNLERAGEA